MWAAGKVVPRVTLSPGPPGVYRFKGIKRGRDKGAEHKGSAPPSSPRRGARVAPQQSPIFRAGNVNNIIQVTGRGGDHGVNSSLTATGEFN
jgi:hypothetical protein